MNHNCCRFGTLTGLAGLLLLQTACSSSTDSVEGKITVVDRTTNALLAANINTLSGTYGPTCAERSTAAGAWLVQLTGGTPSNNLSVVLNDDDCLLTIQLIGIAGNGLAPVLAPLVLDDEFAATARLVPAGATPFYLNASISATTFAEDFYLTLLFSDDPIVSAEAVGSQFAVSQSIVVLESVPAPAIAFGLGTLGFTVDVDNELITATGSATIVDTTAVGDAGVGDVTYFVSLLDADSLTTYAQIDSAYLALDLAGTPIPLGANISAETFGLNPGEALPQVRSLIIANTVEGVRSYTRITITFGPPIND